MARWLAACAAGTLLLAACSAGVGARSGAATWSTPVAAGDLASVPLRVGTSGDYPPFSTESDGVEAGFDVAVARAFAKDRGRELELVELRWPDLEQQLIAGDFDVAMSGVTVRGDRLARAPMTAAVAYADAVLVLRTDRRPLPLLPDGDGLTVGVNRGGHLERLARARLPNARLVTVDDNRRLADLLHGPEVDAIVTDTVEAATFGTSANGAVPGATAEPLIVAVLSRDRKAYWVSPAEPSLADDLDVWLRTHEGSGELAALRAEYGIAPWPRDAGALDWTDAASAADARLIAALELGPSAARVADLMARRLMLMPAVAAAKRAAQLPIADPAREAAVESAARTSAAACGLDPDAYAALARAQIEAAKDVQQAVLAAPPRAASLGAPDAAIPRLPAPDLKHELRPAIDRIDADLRDELARSAPIGAPVAAFAAALHAWAQVPGLDQAAARALAGAALAIPAVRAGAVSVSRGLDEGTASRVTP